jgi:hypothetical protein
MIRLVLAVYRLIESNNLHNEMKKRTMTCGLLVKDYDEALDFYTKKLGFVVVEDVPLGEDRWVTIVCRAIRTVSWRSSASNPGASPCWG